MQKALNECRERFGPPGRTFSFWERLFYLRVKCRAGRDEDDDLNTFFRHKDRLLENGEVVWGHVVQANALLFSPGRDSAVSTIFFARHHLPQRRLCSPLLPIIVRLRSRASTPLPARYWSEKLVEWWSS